MTMSSWWKDWWERFGTPSPAPRRARFRSSPARGGHTEPPTWEQVEATLGVFTLLREGHGEADWTVELLFFSLPANHDSLLRTPYPRRRIQEALDRLVAEGWVEPYLVTDWDGTSHWAYRVRPDKLGER